MKNKKNSNIYLPKERTGYDNTDKEFQSYDKVKHLKNMPNPATDPITVNNIAWQEFDYTEDMTDDDI